MERNDLTHILTHLPPVYANSTSQKQKIFNYFYLQEFGSRKYINLSMTHVKTSQVSHGLEDTCMNTCGTPANSLAQTACMTHAYAFTPPPFPPMRSIFRIVCRRSCQINVKHRAVIPLLIYDFLADAQPRSPCIPLATEFHL